MHAFERPYICFYALHSEVSKKEKKTFFFSFTYHHIEFTQCKLYIYIIDVSKQKNKKNVEKTK